MPASSASASTLRTSIAYVVMLLLAVAAFLWIRQYGEAVFVTLPAVPGHAARAVTASELRPATLLQVLVALTAVVILGRVLGKAFRYLGQPPVIGEVVAGILLGPSVLGQISPEAMELVLPRSTGPFLSVIAQLGVILYMFLVGLELNTGQLRHRAHSAVAISHASIVIPFVLGAALALWLFPRIAPPGVSFTAFSLFIGVAMSVTAFPVLARILTDRGLQRTELGTVALTCAASDDATAWCLLAFVVGVAKAQVSGAVAVIAGTLLFAAVMFVVVRPILSRFVERNQSEGMTVDTVAFVLIALLASAVTTELIGIHAIFGAFILGAIIPHDSPLARAFTEKLHDLVAILLLPAFFAYTGMRTEIGLVSGLEGWLICGAVIVVATLGKFGGTLAAARLTGHPWRESAAIGALMNTRGLMQLIVLDVGLELGVLSPALFAMMVIMALVTTLSTAPLLHLLVPESRAAART